MSEAPERIWAEPGLPGYIDKPNICYTVEYVRADRIEELEADLRKMALDLIAADGQAQEAYQAQLAAEAKLAKAVEALKKLRRRQDCLETYDAFVDEIVATTLAELSSVSCANLEGEK